MMSLGNNNLIYMMGSKENSIPNSQVASDTQTHMQAQFPTYTVVTSPHTRVTQMLTNVAKPSLVSDIDDPVKSPVNKTSIISIVKGTGASNQQIYVRKNANDLSVDGQTRNVSNDVQLIHPRTPVGEASNHYVRKNNGPPNELTNESQNRLIPSDSQLVHHTRVSAPESFSPNMSMNNLAPPSYIDATQYPHRDLGHPSFQMQPPFEIHEPLRPIMHQQQSEQKNQHAHEAARSFHQHNEKKNHVHDLTLSMHQQAEKKNQKRHESSRPLHHQSEKKMHMKHDSSRAIDELGEQKNLQLHESNRSLHQQGQQKHDTIRSIQQQHESNRQMQQHGEQLRETGRTLYHLSDQKNQQMHYQLGDQKNHQMHESARPLYLLGDQKSQPLYESGQQLHQQLEQKGQRMHDPNRSLYPHNDKKKQLHESSRIMHQHEQKNQHGHESLQPLHQLAEQKNQHESLRSSHQHNDQKSQQIHVHKVHHGNARVKYVEFKPVQEGLKYRQMMHHAPHSYNPNQKQTLYYSNHLANNPGSHHLTVQTPTHSPLSPLHSPPALRPPPTIPSGTAWHSPPSLVPSPEVRPRFDFISSPQPITSVGSPCPVQVANMVQHKMFSNKGGKPVNISGNHNIMLPRLPGNYQLSSPGHQNTHANVASRSKAAFNQTPCSNSPGNQPPYDNNQPNFSQTGIPSSSVASTVTVTMTYIPIPTSTKDKFVYVPVNSGQPVVLYQNQQASGKPVLLPPQVLQGGKNIPNSKDIPKDSPYTTVRLQGLVNCGIPKSSNFTTVVGNNQNSPMKGFKYNLANTSMSNHSLKKPPGFFKLDQKPSSFNMDFLDFENEKNNLTPINNKDFILGSDMKQKDEFNIMTDIKLGNQAEVMTLINNQLRLVPPHVGINNQAAHVGMKRNSMGIPMSNNEFILQSPSMHTHEKSVNEQPNGGSIMKDINLEISTNDLKEKKKRGRPPVEKMNKKGKRKEKGKGKLSPMQGNLLTVLSGGQLVSNQVLIDAYKKQQQVQLQKHYFDDPLIKLPDLSPTPESWASEDVHKYLLSTDCACYADAIKAEEIDGKSFLLITREALMDFLGIKLGPALKIAGHAAGLRARQRIYCLTLQEQKMSVPPKEKKNRLPPKNNQKQTESVISNSILSEDISVVPTVQNIVPTELVVPNISILPAPSDESTIKPLLEPSHIETEHSSVILKVPHPLPIILGDSSSSKLPEVIEINGETLEELPTEEKTNSEKLPVTDNVVNDNSTNDTGKIHLELQNMTDNKLDFSQKTLSPSQIHTLTEIELDGITHENS